VYEVRIFAGALVDSAVGIWPPSGETKACIERPRTYRASRNSGAGGGATARAARQDWRPARWHRHSRAPHWTQTRQAPSRTRRCRRTAVGKRYLRAAALRSRGNSRADARNTAAG